LKRKRLIYKIKISPLNRIDRLHAILTHLQSKRKVTAQQIADRFSISLRTVYRDVKALEESGVPVIGEAGTGYTIMEGYRLPPIMFTQEEAAALLMGGKLAQQMTDDSVQKNYEDAMYKIQAVWSSFCPMCRCRHRKYQLKNLPVNTWQRYKSL
jgi:predicted DNA-binding transcriptional regulator YafY